MSGRRYQPRDLAFDELIRVLVSEHVVMKEGLSRVREATLKRDFAEVSSALKQVDAVFRQHIADEEAQILGLLVGELGVKGAEEEIRVFRQHRPIYRLMQGVAELASKKASDLRSEQDSLVRLFDDHTTAEEERVFPRAQRCCNERVRG